MKKNQLMKVLKYDVNTGIFYNLQTGKITGNMDKNGEIRIHIAGQRYRACDLAWLYAHGEMPKYRIMHINGNRGDNWIANLKLLKPIRKNNKTGVPGVSRDKRDKRWRAHISVHGVSKNLGNYRTFDNAVVARYRAEQQLGIKGSRASRYLDKLFL